MWSKNIFGPRAFGPERQRSGTASWRATSARWAALGLSSVFVSLLVLGVVSPAMAQSFGGSLVDGPGVARTNPQFYIKLPFAGPVAFTQGQFDVTVPAALLPSRTIDWRGCSFGGGNLCFDFIVSPTGGHIRGTGAIIADANDPVVYPASQDILSALIVEGAQADRHFASLRSIGGAGFVWFMNFSNMQGNSATWIVGAHPTAPSANGFYEFVNTSFNPARPLPFTASGYYDIVSGSVDASDASSLGVSIELAADPGVVPESSAASPYSPTYTFSIDADGNPATGTNLGFDEFYSVFYVGGMIRTIREIWNGSHLQIAGNQNFAVGKTGSTLLLDIPQASRSDTFRWSVSSALVVNPGSTLAWLAQIDPTSIVQATAFSNPMGGGATQVTTVGQLPQNAVVSNAPTFPAMSAAAWEEMVGGQSVVYGAVFDNSGNVQPGSPFPLQTPSNGSQTVPAIGWVNASQVVFVWSHQGPFPKPAKGALVSSAVGSSIVGRFFDPRGNPTTDAMQISEGDPGESLQPQVSVDDQGSTIVTWEDSGQIRGRVLDDMGIPSTPVIDLTEGSAAVQQLVTATAPGGSFVSAWTTNSGLQAQFFESDGTAFGPEVEVASGDIQNPSVAVSASGTVFLAWDAPGNGRDVFGQRLSSTGVALAPAAVLAADAMGDQRNPSVGANDRGESIVVWESDDGGIDGRFFDVLSSPVSNDVTVVDGTAGTAENPDASLGNDDTATIVYTVRSGGATTLFTETIEAEIASKTCTTSEGTFCALGSRFGVTVNWRDQFGNQGSGRAVPLTADTGYFWFFSQENVELVVKVLDGCGVNDSYWVFAGGLTDVEATIVVDDSVTGTSRTYFNPLKTPFRPIQDTSAFPGCTGARRTRMNEIKTPGEAWADLMSEVGAIDVAGQGAATSALSASQLACDDEGVLCLSDDRFEVEVDWTTATSSGTGQPVAITADTGYFWFFDEANIELVVKVLDACAINNSYWVFAGGLTDQGATVRVTDTTTGAVKTYTNDRGNKFEPVQDTSAFSSCP